MRPRRSNPLLFLGLLLAISCGPQPDEHSAEHPDGESAEHSDETAAHGALELSEAAVENLGIATAAVTRHSVAPGVDVTGRLGYDERRMALATARMGGRISSIEVDYGATVTRGQVLARVDSPELGAARADYLRASTAERLARTEHERAELLLEGGAISRGEYLRRQGELESAEAELEAAIQSLRLLGLSPSDVEAAAESPAAGFDYPVRAPRSGRVTERSASVGQVVDPETPLFVIAELDELWLILQIFEKDLPAVSEGSQVSLECEAHPEDRFEGVIDFVADVVDPHSRTIAARAVIDNREGDLKPGMFVYARISRRPDPGAPAVLAVPASALAAFDEGDEVFVVREATTFERRPVETGRRWDEWIEITSGLEEGEEIVIEGTFALRSKALESGLEGHHH